MANGYKCKMAERLFVFMLQSLHFVLMVKVEVKSVFRVWQGKWGLKIVGGGEAAGQDAVAPRMKRVACRRDP